MSRRRRLHAALVISLIAALSAAAACSQAAPDNDATGPPAAAATDEFGAPATFTTYEERAVGLAIAYPKTWGVKERDGSPFVRFLAPVGPDAESSFIDNANISVEEVGTMTLSEYNATARSQILVVFPDAVVESETPTTLGGQPAVAYVYTASQGHDPVRIRQVFAVHSDRLTALSFAAAVDRWGSLQPTFADMESSFRYLD